jgi:hypothetical protein
MRQISEDAVKRYLKLKKGIIVRCCPSCHSDDYNDNAIYDMDLGKGREVYACCEVRSAIRQYIYKE